MDGSRCSNNLSEISVVGSLLIAPETLMEIEAVLTPRDFGDDYCKSAYIAALTLRDNGQAVDPVLIAAAMKRKTGRDCNQWLLDAMAITPTAANVVEYARLVKADANERRLLNLAEIINDGLYARTGWQAIVGQVSEQLQDLECSTRDDVISGADMAASWGEYTDALSKDPDFAFCRTGFSALDGKLGGGMYRQGMYVIGARPGMGKTTLAINIAENIVKRGKAILFVSLEMGRVQIMAKRIAREKKIGYTNLMSGALSAETKAKAMECVEEITQRPLYLCDKGKVTVADIGRAARQIKDVAAIVIDYLGLIRPVEDNQNKPRYEQMTDISADIKALAKLLDIPIAVLCQLNRESAKTADKRPGLTDLRDSGAIEQDADAVILLHRPEYYKDKTADDYVPPQVEEIELNVAKNRHGETGVVTMQWRGTSGEIYSVDRVHSEMKDTDELPF